VMAYASAAAASVSEGASFWESEDMNA
jgi:hypothetical protein